jgi:hypothetical protein
MKPFTRAFTAAGARGRRPQVLAEAADGLLGAAVLLVAAGLVVDVRRLAELGQQRRQDLDALLHAGGGARPPRLRLALLARLAGGGGRAGRHANQEPRRRQVGGGRER